MVRELRSLNRKKYQRAVNKLIRRFNKTIADDWLWNRRFTVHQKAAEFHPYEDHSGAEFTVAIEMKDNRTGKTAVEWFNNYDIDYRLWAWANNCIVQKWKVWAEVPNPNEQARLEGRTPD